MREFVRYLAITIGVPFLVVAILNIGLWGELWRWFMITINRPPTLEITAEVTDNRLYIPKLGTMAPLIPSAHDPTAPWDDLRQDLESGVSLAPGLAKPGQAGTAWVTGHSSDYGWRKGSYKTVFALLPVLKNGDEIVLDWEKERYRYKVTGHSVVDPSNVTAFQDRGGTTLTLMTCYPPLTTAKRWLVYAELVP